MRKNSLNLRDLHARERDQVMPDAQQRLPLHAHIMRQQQVKVLQHRAGKAVLDGNHSGLHRAPAQRPEDIRGKRAGNDLPIRNQLQSRFVAE